MRIIFYSPFDVKYTCSIRKWREILLISNKDFSIIFVHCGSAINFNTDHIGNVSKITNCFVNIIIHGKRGIRPSGWSSKNSRTNN